MSRFQASSVIKLPDQIPFEQAALAGCAVVTPFHANFEGNVQPGKSVAIIGIGGVGFHGLEWSRIFGGSPIIAVDINDEKLKRAKNNGADYTVNAKNENPIEAVKRLTGGTGADIVFEYIGNKQTMENAIKSTKKGGRTVMVGITPQTIEYNALDLLNNGQTITVCQNHTRDQLKAVLRLMVLGRIDIGKSITARHSLKDAAIAVDELNTQSNNPTRIVFNPIAKFLEPEQYSGVAAGASMLLHPSLMYSKSFLFIEKVLSIFILPIGTQDVVRSFWASFPAPLKRIARFHTISIWNTG